ncbi:MAG: hypothetical protein ACKVTZ_06760 [Bacteroidia bacterium]
MNCYQRLTFLFLGISLFSACNFQDETDAQSVTRATYKEDSIQATYILQKVKIAEAINDSLAKDSLKQGRFQPMPSLLPNISPDERKHLRKEVPQPADSVKTDSIKK